MIDKKTVRDFRRIDLFMTGISTMIILAIYGGLVLALGPVRTGVAAFCLLAVMTYRANRTKKNRKVALDALKALLCHSAYVGYGILAQRFHILWAVLLTCLAINIILLVKARPVSPDKRKVLRSWAVLGQKPKDFPITSIERTKLRDWATGILAELAGAATASFRTRDARLSERSVAEQKLRRLKEDESRCDPKHLRAFRQDIKEAERQLRKKRRAAAKAEVRATATNAKFLATWDFLTFDATGAGILPDNRCTSPESFRLRLHSAAPPNAVPTAS